MTTAKPVYLLLLSIVAAMLDGCAGNREPTRFYLLEPLSPAETNPTAAKGEAFVLGFGPVRFPHYLDRPQIVSGATSVELKLSEYHRWAERLEENFTRVLIENLSVLNPNAQILVYPWRRSPPVDLSVSLDVLRFHTDPEGVSRLTARWNLSKEGRVLLENKSDIGIPASSSDYAAMVRAQSACVAQLSREITSALTRFAGSLPSQNP